jgi:hypothetical protein
MRRTIGAAAQQVVGGRTYNFVAWSDSGAAAHDITTPASSTTYTATYVEVQGGGGSSDVDVTTTTTGASPDPDGYMIVGDGSVLRPIGTNDTVRFSGVGAGAHTARLDSVAANCTVSGANPRPVNVVAGTLTTVIFAVQCDSVAPPPPPAPLHISGSGTVGQVTLDLDATNAPAGTLRLVDRSIVRGDGTYGSATIAPSSDAATGVTSLTRTSVSCVTLAGHARIDTGELVDITVDACDNGSPGAGADTFVVNVPFFGYRVEGTLTAGELVLAQP